MNSILRTVVMLVLSLVAAFSVSAQQNPKPKPGGSEKDSGKFYKLPATPENVQWGWFDVNEKPKLTVNSGDTVSVETWYHALSQVKPTSEDHTLNGPSMDDLARLRKENDGGGPHSITGPICVNRLRYGHRGRSLAANEGVF